MVVAEACDCNYHKGGCTISKLATPGNACKCVYKGAWTCSGFEVGCSMKIPLCAKPDASVYSCVLGNGDCGGYAVNGTDLSNIKKQVNDMLTKIDNILKKANGMATVEFL